MEASERHHSALDREPPGTAVRRDAVLIDPGAINLGPGPGLARLELMLNTVLERLTAVDPLTGREL